MESKLKTVFLAPIFVLSTRLPATNTAAKFKKCKHWFSRGNLRIRFSRYMAFFKQTRELLLIEHSEKAISDEELLLLLDENTSRNPELSYENYERFNLEEIEEPECKANFRFQKDDIPELAEVLGLPEVFRCSQRTVADQLEGLCLLLRRMAYPCRYSDLIPQFGRPAPELSMISNCVIDEIFNQHAHRIKQWNHEILNPYQPEIYADAIHTKGAAPNNCFGFVDGTVRAISRPFENQEITYNGHKRIHAVKFQSVTLPNGLMANMYGPVGRSHKLSGKNKFCRSFFQLRS